MNEENNELQDLVSETFDDETAFPVLEFDENEEVINDENQTKENDFELTFSEKRKYLRAMGRIEMTDQEIENLSDDEVEEIKEFVKLKEKKAIYRFVTRKKKVTDEDIANLSDDDFKEMIAKSFILSRHFNYRPKKNFGVAYKKERQRKNKQAKASRKANR